MIDNADLKSNTALTIKADYSLIDEYRKNPRPVVLLGSTEDSIVLPQTPYTAYIELCSRFNIQIRCICDTDKTKHGNNIKGVEIAAPETKIGSSSTDYICIVSQPVQIKRKLLTFVKKSGFSGVVYSDFPFGVPTLMWPWLRQWSGEKWFYDMLYGDMPGYASDPQGYFEDVHMHGGIIPKNNVFVMKDFAGKYVNIRGNLRVTTNQPSSYKHKIMLFGSCIAYGDRVEDAFTLPSILQRRLNNTAPNTWLVQNYGVISQNFVNFYNMIFSAPVEKDDIVIFLDQPMLNFKSSEDGTADTVKYAYVLFDLVKEVKTYCEKKGASFYFFDYLSLHFNINPTNFEKQLIMKLPGTLAQQRERYSQMSEKDKKSKPLLKLKTPPLPGWFENTGIVDRKVLSELCLENGVRYLETSKYFRRPHNWGETHVDKSHLGFAGNAVLAYEIRDLLISEQYFEKEAIKTLALRKDTLDNFQKIMTSACTTQELTNHLGTLRKTACDKPDGAGVIVMNCNPFTYGHRYLIETAAKQVPHLYILVVEEDKSVFTFKDRYQMVLDGTADMENVTVLPSGRFVISSITFAEYFTKETEKTTQIDASNDLTIFSTKIAPALKASKRFVGEEPFCVVTNAYNEQMKAILPQNGIELVVVPRKESNGIAISATTGRKMLQDNDIEGMKDIFPPTTLAHLKKIGKIGDLFDEVQGDTV